MKRESWRMLKKESEYNHFATHITGHLYIPICIIYRCREGRAFFDLCFVFLQPIISLLPLGNAGTAVWWLSSGRYFCVIQLSKSINAIYG